MGRSADVRHLFGQGMHTKGLICMEDIIAILEELVPDVDVKTCTTLVDGRYLDSLAIVALIAELEDAFDITIPAVEIVADNFNSAEDIMVLVNRLSEE